MRINHDHRFSHGFVLGLLVDLSDRYMVTSNRESGFGRYNIMIELTLQAAVENIFFIWAVQASDPTLPIF